MIEDGEKNPGGYGFFRVNSFLSSIWLRSLVYKASREWRNEFSGVIKRACADERVHEAVANSARAILQTECAD